MDSDDWAKARPDEGIFAFVTELLEICHRLNSSGADAVDPKLLRLISKFASDLKNHRLKTKAGRDFLLIEMVDRISPFMKRFREGDISYAKLRESIIRAVPNRCQPFLGLDENGIVSLVDDLALKNGEELHKLMSDQREGANDLVNGPVEATCWLVAKLFGVSKSYAIKRRKFYRDSDVYSFVTGHDLAEQPQWRKYALRRIYGLTAQDAEREHEKLSKLVPTNPLSNKFRKILDGFLKERTERACRLDSEKLSDGWQDS